MEYDDQGVAGRTRRASSGRLMNAPFASDTSLEAARVYFAVLRRLGVAGRARQAVELNATVRGLLAAGIRHRHPEYTEGQVQQAVIRRVLNRERSEVACGRADG